MQTNSLNTAAEVKAALLSYARHEKAVGLSRFFKTGPGQYGEGDRFCGVMVPQVRAVARQALDLDRDEIEILLQDDLHEVRLCGFLVMVEQYRRQPDRRAEIVDYYLSRLHRANNWDLVDLTAPRILGHWLLDKDRSVLYRLSESTLLWEQRVAIISTMTFINHNQFDDTLALVKKQMHHSHDLMHKANGWMLREIGKRNRSVLTAFLDEYTTRLPRTTLRYAIEHYSAEERQYYLKKK
ncbi:MAG: DNA alkylation repair protein [Bacteroidales bacterium]|nr:DNA alkylation repair protein [Bacteroidales bacterium]MDD4429863.1 DNA alkylation repair protein [Bacteroidales bacterium]